MDLPLNVQTGLVTGRYIVDVVDGPDENLDPDAQPARGRIVFTASVPYLPNPTAAPDPVTIMRAPIVGVLDADGYLCTPYAGSLEPLYRGVRLIATDDPDIAVNDWTWDVTYIFEPINGHKLAIPAHGFSLPSGETVDLTKVAKVPSSPGYSLPQAEAAVLRAEAIAQSIRDDADNGVFNGEAATLEIGAVTSGASVDVVNVGDAQHAILNFTLEKGEKGDTGTGVPDAGAALQVMRMDSAGVGTEWVTPTKAIVGLSNVDNTADADKPISTATQTALEAKASIIQLDTKADRRITDVLYTDTSGYIFIVDQSAASGSTLRYEDTPDHDGSILHIAHRGGTVGTGQAYGINLANYPEAKGGFIGHQYSKKSPFFQIDNTDINADGGSALLINKTSTGLGDAVRIINPGTGPSIDFRNAGGAVAKVNPNGEYEHLTAGAGIILKSPNGTRYRATVTDAGALALTVA